MTRDELEAALAAAGERRAHAESERTEAMQELADLMRAADGVLSVAHVARLAGVTRQTVYDLRR